MGKGQANGEGTYVIGLDYGSDSVRAVLVNTADGAQLASEVFAYPRWAEGRYCDPSKNRFRQHLRDHIEGLETTIKAVITQTGVSRGAIKGICVDTTGSSPLPLAQTGRPLCLEAGFEENPNAMMVLWKDHTALAEAEEINRLARSWGGPDLTKYEGGIYSSEWFWAKILHVSREDAEVAQNAHWWIEHCDYMTMMLIGAQTPDTVKHSRCAAGHKAMWHPEWGGLPPKEFLGALDPYLSELRDRLYSDTYTSDVVAGTLCEEWAEKLGLDTDTVVAVGTFDAHAGAVGAKIDAGNLVRVMGTSTCDILVAPNAAIGDRTVEGICGQVDGSVIPGMTGLEAGQSAFGDVLAWFRDVLSWPLEQLIYTSDILSADQKERLKEEASAQFMAKLSEAAAALPMEEGVPTALDWVNGRRTPDADQNLKSALMGLSLGTRAPHIFKALVNAICFGSKKIVERFEREGVTIDSVTGIGGVARKSPFVMQTLADVLDRPIKVSASDQAPALGAAIYAATAAGIYGSVIEAARQMGSPYEAEYLPEPRAVAWFAEQIKSYEALGGFVESQYQKKETVTASS